MNRKQYRQNIAQENKQKRKKTWKNIGKLFQKCVEENKIKKKLKSLKVDVVSNFVKDKFENFSDAEVYTDDESEEDSVVII